MMVIVMDRIIVNVNEFFVFVYFVPCKINAASNKMFSYLCKVIIKYCIVNMKFFIFVHSRTALFT